MAAEPTILVTGFEPFGGDDLNPSALVARELSGRRIAGAMVASRILPVDLDGLDRFAPALDAVAGRMDGTPDVLRVIEHRLRQGSRSPLASRVEPV